MPVILTSRLLAIILPVTILPGPRARPPAMGPADTTALVNVNVVPMDRERILTRRAILVAGGRIIALGSVDSVAIPAGARVLDGHDRWFVTPGLADMHVHLRYESDLTLLLANGITLVRNMRGTPWHLDIRRRVADGTLAGPRIVTAGPVFYGYRGAGATAEEARALVDSQATAGYDFIKVYDRLPQPAYQAAVDEAGRRGLPVAGHVPGDGTYGTGLARALELHQASIEHAEQFIYHYFGDDLDPARIPEVARAVRAAGTTVTPTLVTIPGLIAQWERHDSMLAAPASRYLTPETYAWWRTDPGHSSAINRTFVPFLSALVAGLHRAGVPLMAGTDFYLPGTVAGASLHEELRLLVGAGLTPFEALAAATRVPAEYLRDTVNSGTIAVGRRADLLVLEGNPLEDITQTTRRVGMMAVGRWHSQRELDSATAALARRWAPQHRAIDDLVAHGADAAVLRARAGSSDHIAVDENALSQLVPYFTAQKRTRDAIAVAEWGVRLHPADSTARLQLAATRKAASGPGAPK